MKTALALLLLATPAAATELTLPFPAEPLLAETRDLGSHRVATGRYDDGLPATVAEGSVTRRTWSMSGAATTLEVMAPLRDQLLADGWTEVFQCQTRTCGGFNFRFEIDVSPAPDMFVDLADFRYLSARKDKAWTTLLVSRSGARDYLQMTSVDPDAATVPTLSTSGAADRAPLTAPSDLAQRLVEAGHVVLSDLDFASGSTTLAESDYTSLTRLAAFLAANPGVRVALIGHTDAQGDTDTNLALSRDRAQSVRQLLIDRHGISGDRLESRGVAYFAPIARNDTDAGRRLNRRVEAVLVSTN